MTDNITLSTITASEGMILTNGSVFSSAGGTVFLGVNDSAENWHEITQAEYELEVQKIAEAEKAFEAELSEADNGLDEQ